MTASASLAPAAGNGFSLRPSHSAKIICGLAGITFFLGSNQSVLGWLGLATGIVTIFFYRSMRRHRQQSLNATAAASIGDRSFILYLRPFFTSRRLPVRCRLQGLFERWIIGRFWDLELALSLAVEGKKPLVAVGDQSGSLGAAKLISTDEGWQELVLRLVRQSAAVVVVPFARPGTLWEIIQIFAAHDLLRKTVFVMPPTTIWQEIYGRILLWRRSTSSRWTEAAHALEPHGIRLPAYNRKGALLLSDGSTFTAYETCHFHPAYISDFLDRLVDEDSNKSPASDDKLVRLIERFPRRLPITTWIFFFDPIRVGAWLVAAVIFRVFLYAAFNVPSASMYPTFEVGDHLYASKLAYGYSKYSFSLEGEWLPGLTFELGPLSTDRRFFTTSAPKLGDVVVFKLPRDNRTDYIKRIVGMPGDRVQMIDGVLFINGRAVPKQRIADFVDERETGTSQRFIPQFAETLPNGVTYNVLDQTAHGSVDDTGEYVVPQEHYFVMGDHRDNSLDSRMAQNAGGVGYVPYENIIGRADVVYFSIRPNAAWWQPWKWPIGIRWSRIFKVIH